MKIKKTAKDKLIELFKDKPVGAVMTWREVAKTLGVSSRTVDRLLQNEEILLKQGITVVRTVSFLKSSSPSGESIAVPKADDDGESIAIPKTGDDDGESIAVPKADDDGESIAVPKTGSDDDSETLPFDLPKGYRVGWHKYVGRVVVDERGLIDEHLTNLINPVHKALTSGRAGNF